MTEAVLRVDGLRVELDSGEPIVEDVSLELRAGEVLGLVGESGSGKTTTALALLGYARRGARIAAGTVAGRRQAADRPARSAPCARSAAGSSRTSPRIPAPRSTPRSGSAT